MQKEGFGSLAKERWPVLDSRNIWLAEECGHTLGKTSVAIYGIILML